MKAIYGGTFDPPTLAHMAAAQAFHQALGQPITWMPNHQSPLKGAASADGHRIAMLSEILDPDPRFDLSLLEMQRAGPSYTVDTLEQLRGDDPDQPLIWCLGGDSFNSIQQWGRWQRLLDFASLVVAARPGSRPAPPAEWTDRQCKLAHITDHPSGYWCEIEMTQMDLASSRVRQAINNGQPWQHWVAPAIAEYIKDNHLYVDEHG